MSQSGENNENTIYPGFFTTWTYTVKQIFFFIYRNMKVVKLTFPLRWKLQYVSPSSGILRYRLAFGKPALSPCSDWQCSFLISHHSELISPRFPKCLSEYWLSVTFTAGIILKKLLSIGDLVELMSGWTFDKAEVWLEKYFTITNSYYDDLVDIHIYIYEHTHMYQVDLEGHIQKYSLKNCNCLKRSL